MKIITNHVPRDIIYGYELSDKEWEEFDYLDREKDATHMFVRYKGELYDLDEFMSARGMQKLENWDGYMSDTFFSGILIKWVENFEQVTMGRYCA